ncbi:MAG: hypothetical protein LC797_18285, partial [Chloroflexi bacterium]|nr:hypothetical protein [Chloroflexota bacterium]
MSTPAPSQLCEEAIRLLGDALGKPPAELKAEVDVLERTIVALRDALIDRLRQTPTDPVRSTVDRVNVALSLVVGLEYPVGGLDRNMLK